MLDALLVSSQHIPEGFFTHATSSPNRLGLHTQEPAFISLGSSGLRISSAYPNSLGVSDQLKEGGVTWPFHSSERRYNTDVRVGMEQAKRTVRFLKEYGRRSLRKSQNNAEMQWLAENRHRYSGRWIAVQGATLLAVGDTAREVFAKVASQLVTPLVIRIDDESRPFAGW
jgi:hypothetical protein